jgi:hypothetical protein
MGNFRDVDLFISKDGDLLLNSEGDLAVVKDINYVAQTVHNRLRSIAEDWFYDQSGANIEEFIGLPNTQENASALADQITNALIKDGFCDIDDLLVIGKPVSASMVSIGIFVKTEFESKPVGFILEMDYLNEFIIRRV